MDSIQVNAKIFKEKAINVKPSSNHGRTVKRTTYMKQETSTKNRGPSGYSTDEATRLELDLLGTSPIQSTGQYMREISPGVM